MGMRFFGHIPNSPTSKILKKHISYLLEKVVFWDSKRLLIPLGRDKNYNFNFFLKQQRPFDDHIREETSIRHIDIEVIYKILQLKVPKLVPIFHYSACFQRGCLELVLSKRPFVL
jgi:hypothetical protein